MILRKLLFLVEPPKTALCANSKSTRLLLSEMSTDFVRAEDESISGLDEEDFISPVQSSEASSPLYFRLSYDFFLDSPDCFTTTIVSSIELSGVSIDCML